MLAIAGGVFLGLVIFGLVFSEGGLKFLGSALGLLISIAVVGGILGLGFYVSGLK